MFCCPAADLPPVFSAIFVWVKVSFCSVRKSAPVPMPSSPTG
jgi:hypothetical protein